MDVTLLGTGNAAGWPHPFCTCSSCAAAYAEGEIRAHTSALVDSVLLLDCGQDVARSAVRLGVRLDAIRYLLVTHDHHDHANGALLLLRHWAGRDEPLRVFGPASALDSLRPWLPPDETRVEFTVVTGGDVLQLGHYTVQVLRADHDSAGAVLYDIADPAHRMLYATDTGPDFVTPPDARYDLLLLENAWGERPKPGATGHHSLATFGTTLARLRRAGVLDERSRMVAVHVGHGDQAPSVLRKKLAAMDAELLNDGTLIRLGKVRVPRPLGRSGRRTLVIGGARSGKSRTAEQLLMSEPHVVYIATANREPDEPDDEWAARLAIHQARRPRDWSTVETLDLVPLLERSTPEMPALLIECLTLWLARIMDDVEVWSAAADEKPAAEAKLASAIDGLVEAWRTTRGRVVAVTNDVGSGLVPEYPSGRRFRDELGTLNSRIAAVSDEVLFVEAGVARSLLAERSRRE
jgi:adenosylcobinamide kinase / adenosylcobinamide-phosphate guanylyltransferase